ncbi:hypothetical protein X777_12853 [Ooceraea biroi]|uniref:Uncharacterized protein n=1 Tax=Ooceraea biroi TaxID=2015173 RepID=A0A026VZ04_OOCBI|nr:hypothetical protein X777_12853 [Ooceraea biroi]
MLADVTLTLDLFLEPETILPRILNTAEQYLGSGRKFLTMIFNYTLSISPYKWYIYK